MALVSFKTKHGVVRFKAGGAKRKSSAKRTSRKGKVPAHLKKYLFTSKTAKKASAKARRTRRR